jgi:hypothetical protein
VVFPSDAPDQATGPGAIVWAAGRGCPTGAGTKLDAIGPDSTPEPPETPHSAAGRTLAVLAPLEVATAPHGLIAITGTDPRRRAERLLIQGRADGPFAALGAGATIPAPSALTTAYLGDLGFLASSGAEGTGGLLVEIERWFAHRTGRRALITGPKTGDDQPAALAMDYRSDALAVWSRHGHLYARDLPASGVLHRPQQLGPAGANPHVAALLSDDNRAVVIWADSSGQTTSVYLDYSAPGVRFGRPQLLERFTDPAGLSSPAGSPQLIRLSSESVMAAWSGAAAGHWVLRTAPIDQRGLRTVSTITAPTGDALLSALAPGPRGEAILLWTQPQLSPTGHPMPGRQSLLAARGTDAAPGVAQFGRAQLIAPPGPVSGATVAVDPRSDMAIAVWLGEHDSIRYSVHAPTPTG